MGTLMTRVLAHAARPGTSCQAARVPPVAVSASVVPVAGRARVIARPAGSGGSCRGGRLADGDPGDGQHREDRRRDQALVQQRRAERGHHGGIVDVDAAVHPGHGVRRPPGSSRCPPGRASSGGTGAVSASRSTARAADHEQNVISCHARLTCEADGPAYNYNLSQVRLGRSWGSRPVTVASTVTCPASSG